MGDFSPTTPIKFMSGIFISSSAAQRVVPHLQRVFQADDCHMNFGKYTLARKAGHPKNDKQIKSPLEGKKKRKRAAETTGEPPPKRSKQGGKSGGGGRKRSAD